MTRLLEIEELNVLFNTRYGKVTALDAVSLYVDEGETLCVVGESGCGKSVTALATMGLIPSPPGEIANGSIRLEGLDITHANERQLAAIRGRDIAMIFQEPMTSLNPVFSVGDQIKEAILLHQNVSNSKASLMTLELLERVGIPSPDQRAKDFPHQLSGGMRQRVMIAMAISCQPKVLIADEPTTALDVTVQAQIFDLLNEIQREMGTAIIMITHDMGAVSAMSDRTVVMYAGRIIEQGNTDDVLDHPKHPYTHGLIECIPSGVTDKGMLKEIPGVVPPLHQLGLGCAFRDRCDYADDLCSRAKPPMTDNDTHKVACYAIEKGRLPWRS